MKGKDKAKKFKKENLYSFFGLFVLFYGFVMISRAIYNNYQLNQGILRLGEQVEEMREENEVLRNKIAYYKTDVYKEREARARLDLKKPGEKVIIIVDPKEQEEEEKKLEKLRDTKSNPEKWFDVFFG